MSRAVKIAVNHAGKKYIFQNATDEQCKSVYKSYGIWTHVLANMEPKKVIRLQNLNQFFYKAAIGRVQVNLKVNPEISSFYFMWN